MAKTTMGRAPRPHKEPAAHRRPTHDASATGSDRGSGIDRTQDGRQPTNACELFQAAELERMGLLPENDTAHVGALFVGDGTRASGWYHAWAGNGFTVVTCDFTMLVDTLFGIDTRRYLTVRGPAPSATTSPKDATTPSDTAAIAYIETREGWVTTPVPAGTRFTYTEVEYFDETLRAAFARLGRGSVEEISSLLADMRGDVSWAPSVLLALEEIGRADPAGSGTALIYEGAAKLLLGSLVQTAAEALPADRRARAGILAAIELANARLREGASQKEAAAVAGMGLTTFKRLFRQATGSSWSTYLTMRRMREARLLLACGSTVEHAALAVGYRSPTSFSAAFARAHGMSPSQWRAASRMNVARVADAAGRAPSMRTGTARASSERR